MRAINGWIQQAAGTGTAGRLWFVDTRAAVAAPNDPDSLAASPDGLHPDIEGYRRMADALLPAIGAAAGDLPTA
jgi:lysophospholipase L1-like esterase